MGRFILSSWRTLDKKKPEEEFDVPMECHGGAETFHLFSTFNHKQSWTKKSIKWPNVWVKKNKLPQRSVLGPL